MGDRATLVNRHVGLPVLQGGLSTFIGILPTVGSKSQIFFTFFVIVFLVILFGLFHGLVFVPAFFSFMGGCLEPNSAVTAAEAGEKTQHPKQEGVDTPSVEVPTATPAGGQTVMLEV